jgi:hypothetical protein
VGLEKEIAYTVTTPVTGAKDQYERLPYPGIRQETKMKSIFKSLGTIGLLAGFSAFAGAATMTMDGMISDSMC